MSKPDMSEAAAPPAKTLTPEAQRALAEAEARRVSQAAAVPAALTGGEKEIGGRNGPDPVRFGDWERGGLASDF